jgi:NFU1 iron-sulfur cluster scaffold homolog, mitochondrial
MVAAQVHRRVGASAEEGAKKELTRENVDRVLNEIRGYLFADGGDIDVVDVSKDEGKVFVRFQGNCANCGSQETTMVMGVERSLRAAFGDALKEVVRMDPPQPREPANVTVGAVNSLLDLLRPAIQSYGGSVKAQSVEGGVVHVAYEGPDPIWNGVQSAIKDRFEDVHDVVRA